MRFVLKIGLSFLERTFFNFFWFLKHFSGVDRFSALQAKLKLGLLNEEIALPQFNVVEIRDFDWQKMGGFKEFLNSNQPVILRGAALDWGAIGKWNLDFFETHYGDVEQLKIEQSPSALAQKKREKAAIIRSNMREMIQAIKNKKKEYANFNPILHFYPELFKDLRIDRVFRLADFFRPNKMYQLFIGAQETKTDLHCAISSNIFVQVYGKKRWILMPPAFTPFLDVKVTREPCFHSELNFLDKNLRNASKVPYAEFTLEPGDIFFNPPFFWHQVVNDTHSIGLSIKWNCFYRFYKVSAAMTLLTTFCTNPPVWKVLGGKGQYMNIFTNDRKIAK